MNLAIPIPPRRRRRRHQRRDAALRSLVLARRARPRFEWLEDRTVLATFLVSNTGDSGPGSLRQAILDSNAASGATNTIDFDIPGSGVQTVAPLSSLPAITNPVLIDGDSQPGYAGTPLIELDGSQAGGGDGLTITGSGVTVRGLDIGGFSQGAGIHLTGTGTTGDWIYGNFLGTDATGETADPDKEGVEIDGGATLNRIGTDGDGVNDAAERNLISGNSFAGIVINGRGTDGNAIAGNFIGTSVTGEVALDNGTVPALFIAKNSMSTSFLLHIGGGVVIEGGASNNRIGTDGSSVDDAGQRNIIAGSDVDGVEILSGSPVTEGNIVAGNFIGTDLTGTIGLGIVRNGVYIVPNLFGGTVSSNWVEGNVISGTGSDGVRIDGSADNVVAGNKIGTDATGAVALGNSADGVQIYSSSGTTIGGATAAAGNLIAYNGGPGVQVGFPATAINTAIGNAITDNRIFGNTGPAIELGGAGVTANGTAPRQGPNNLQNFPILITTAGGQTEGWLGGSELDTAYRIDVFASTAYGPGGAGEAQDYLGSLVATTDAIGQVTFVVPFAAPAGLPDITATATDPTGNTSEVTTLRPGVLVVPSQAVRLAPGQPATFSAASGDSIALQDPDVGPFNPAWDLTLSVLTGTLTLSTTAGLAGTGDGTGSLSYQGSLSAIDAAIDGLTYTPPPGDYLNTELSLNATSTARPPSKLRSSSPMVSSWSPRRPTAAPVRSARPSLIPTSMWTGRIRSTSRSRVPASRRSRRSRRCRRLPTRWSSTAPRSRATPARRGSPSPAREPQTPTR